jgi:amidase
LAAPGLAATAAATSERRPAFDRSGVLVSPAGHAVPDLLRRDGSALADAMSQGAISSVELVSACLDRIEELNPRYNAVVSLRPREDILADARKADEARRQGDGTGSLHGLPIAVKDISPAAGIRTTWGSPLFAGYVPLDDNLMVARLKQAGAIVIGKTNTPEFGLGSHTYNPVFGATRNAFAPDRSAGGSSGGAAVALALRMLPIADGSDFGGSLRNPGAWNNVFGLRPSQGRVPNSPSNDPFYGQLGTLGPMGRSVRDMAMLLSVMAGPAEDAPLALPKPAAAFESCLDRSKAPRIAWLGDLHDHLAFEDGVTALCETALDELRSAGWFVEHVASPFRWEELWTAFVRLRCWANIGRLGDHYADPEKRRLLKPEAVWEIEEALKLDAVALASAAKARGACFSKLAVLLRDFDAVAMPSAQTFPFPVEWAWPRRIAGREMDSYHRWMEVVVPGTMSGCPVVNLPAGFDGRGLPMGMQFIGRPQADADLLAIAAMYERDAARER